MVAIDVDRIDRCSYDWRQRTVSYDQATGTKTDTVRAQAVHHGLEGRREGVDGIRAPSYRTVPVSRSSAELTPGHYMHSRTRHVLVLAVLLILIGGAVAGYKAVVYQVPVVPDASVPGWNVDARVSFSPVQKTPVKLVLAVPQPKVPLTLLNETVVAPGYGMTEGRDGPNRIMTWTIRRVSGNQTLFYQARVAAAGNSSSASSAPPPPPPSYPQLDEPEATALAGIVTEVRRTSADVLTFAQRVLELIDEADEVGGINLFVDGSRTPQSRAQAAKLILSGARIAARVVHGVDLSEERKEAPLAIRLEVHNGRQWLMLDPVSGNRVDTSRFLVWSYDTPPLLEAEGARRVQVRVSVAAVPLEFVALLDSRLANGGMGLARLSLLDLPAETQSVYAIMLTIPLGALLIVVLRNIVGLHTFGTFAPILIAIAFRETQLLSGVLLFIGIIGIALLVRFYLERLQLMLVPRLAVVVTVVLLLMLLVDVVGYRMRWHVGLSASLLPIIILAMVVERMSLVWEETGGKNAVMRAGGSLVAAILGYLATSQPLVEYLFLAFPELVLVVLAMLLMLGRYSGFRLTELRRFAAMRESTP